MTAGIDRRAVFRRTELARTIEVLQRKTDRVHDLVTAGTGCIGGVRSEALACRPQRQRRSVDFSENGPSQDPGRKVGVGGGYGAFYCFALAP